MAEERLDLLAALCAESVEQDGAECIILAGGPLAGIAPLLQPRVAVPLVDGTQAAVRLAEAMAGLMPRHPRAHRARALTGFAPEVVGAVRRLTRHGRMRRPGRRVVAVPPQTPCSEKSNRQSSRRSNSDKSGHVGRGAGESCGPPPSPTPPIETRVIAHCTERLAGLGVQHHLLRRGAARPPR